MASYYKADRFSKSIQSYYSLEFGNFDICFQLFSREIKFMTLSHGDDSTLKIIIQVHFSSGYFKSPCNYLRSKSN